MKNQQSKKVCHCGKEFYVSPSCVERRKSCSKVCASALRKSDDPKHKTKNNQRWRERNINKMQGIRRRYLYDVSQEQIDQMYIDQKGLCAICKTNPATDLDHNHETNKARSLLCGNCNRSLGLLKESITTLRSAIEYLESWADGRGN